VYLVAGLGNPGPKYASHRHNVGFMVADQLADRWRCDLRDKFKGEFAKARVGKQEAILLKPMTYMNLSGESVQRAMHFFKVPTEQLVVIHDELDLPFGAVRVKSGGGTAGHNGLRSLAQHAGSGFVRVRIGIDRPKGQPVDAYVLSDFGAMEKAELEDVLARAADAVEAVVTKGPRSAMNTFNADKKGKGKGKGGKGEAKGDAP
jgi:PTH1 family peptidyl-tRNA hydrolase